MHTFKFAGFCLALLVLQFDIGNRVIMSGNLGPDARERRTWALCSLQCTCVFQLLALSIVLGDALSKAGDLRLAVVGSRRGRTVILFMVLGFVLGAGTEAFMGFGVAIRFRRELLKQGMQIGSGPREAGAVGSEIALNTLQLRVQFLLLMLGRGEPTRDVGGTGGAKAAA